MGYEADRATRERREQLLENQGSVPVLGRLVNAEVGRGANAVVQIGLRCHHDGPCREGAIRWVPPSGRRGEVPVQAHELPWGDHLRAGNKMACHGCKAGSSFDQVDRKVSVKQSSVGRPRRACLRRA